MSYSETACWLPFAAAAYTVAACVKPGLLKPFGEVIVEGHETPLNAVPGSPVPAGLRAAVASEAPNPAKAKVDAAQIANLRMSRPPVVVAGDDTWRPRNHANPSRLDG